MKIIISLLSCLHQKIKFQFTYFSAPNQKYLLLFLILMSLGAPSITNAQQDTIAQQDTTTIWNIITLDDNEFNGTIISRDVNTIKLNTENLGIITIQSKDIKKITKVNPKNIKDGSVWMPNPQESRYFWGPSGYGLKAGESYYQNVWLFFNQVAFGVTDNFSMGIGMIPLFLFGGSDFPLWVTPKLSFPSENENFSFGAGGLFATIVGQGGSIGIVYGTATTGTRDQNFSFGLGYGYADGEWSSIPTVMASAMVRTGKRGYFMTENYLFDGGDDLVVVLSFGGRRIFSGGASLDYGGFIPVGNVDGIAIIPFLGIVIPFGNKKGIE